MKKPTEESVHSNLGRKESVKLPQSPPIDYPDEQNPFASEFTEPEEKTPVDKPALPPLDKPALLPLDQPPAQRQPVSKILPPKTPLQESKIEVEEAEVPPKPIEYVQQETPLSPAEAADLNRATKAVVTYYDDNDNLINQYNLAKNEQSDKLDDFNLDLEPNSDLINHTNTLTSIYSDIQFIDDDANSFELVDETEAASKLEIQEMQIKESLNYLAETYYKNDFDRFFSDPTSGYDQEVNAVQFNNMVNENRGSLGTRVTGNAKKGNKKK